MDRMDLCDDAQTYILLKSMS